MNKLGVAYEKDKQKENAYKNYRESLKLDPNYAPALLALGNLLQDSQSQKLFQNIDKDSVNNETPKTDNNDSSDEAAHISVASGGNESLIPEKIFVVIKRNSNYRTYAHNIGWHIYQNIGNVKYDYESIREIRSTTIIHFTENKYKKAAEIIEDLIPYDQLVKPLPDSYKFSKKSVNANIIIELGKDSRNINNML